MAQERETQQDSFAQTSLDNVDLSDVVSPFETPEPEATEHLVPIFEKIDRGRNFAISQKQALSSHYPLRHKRLKAFDQSPIEKSTYKRSLAEVDDIKLEVDDLSRPDPDLSCLEFKPGDFYEKPVFIAAGDLKEIADIIKGSNAVLDEEEVDPEVLEVLEEEMSRGIIGGEEPTQYSEMIASDIRKKTYPLEDSFEHDSRP